MGSILAYLSEWIASAAKSILRDAQTMMNPSRYVTASPEIKTLSPAFLQRSFPILDDNCKAVIESLLSLSLQ